MMRNLAPVSPPIVLIFVFVFTLSPLIVAVESLSVPQPSAGKSKQVEGVMSKPRILCLHGKGQSGDSFSKKIGGARRKLERAFDLTFLDGPINLDDGEEQQQQDTTITWTGRAWFQREEVEGSGSGKYRYTKLTEAIEYVSRYNTQHGPYDALMGFSQGGTLACALATSGAIPGIRAVLTAGSPHVEETFVAASEWSSKQNRDDTPSKIADVGLSIPKLHLAGETDTMIPIDSTAKLSERGGSGELVVHEKGHLFPTRAVHVDRMVDFLKSSLIEQSS